MTKITIKYFHLDCLQRLFASGVMKVVYLIKAREAHTFFDFKVAT